MALARTILAVLIAVAVAILPALAGAAFKLPAAGIAEMSVAEPMHNCCPDESNPCDRQVQDRTCMATCVLNCFNFWSAPFTYLTLPPTDLTAVSLPATAALQARAVGPPFRPPRS
jgi:hypothetical protein